MVLQWRANRVGGAEEAGTVSVGHWQGGWGPAKETYRFEVPDGSCCLIESVQEQGSQENAPGLEWL